MPPSQILTISSKAIRAARILSILYFMHSLLLIAGYIYFYNDMLNMGGLYLVGPLMLLPIVIPLLIFMIFLAFKLMRQKILTKESARTIVNRSLIFSAILCVVVPMFGIVLLIGSLYFYNCLRAQADNIPTSTDIPQPPKNIIAG